MADEAKQIDDGGPINPRPVRSATAAGDRPFTSVTEFQLEGSGLSIRDYFATAAMQGLVGIVLSPDDSGCERLYDVDGNTRNNLRSLAIDSYSIADAMLAARKRPTE
jgi:hypothetical protein